MSETVHKVFKFKDGSLAGEADIELPTSFDEVAALVPEDKALSYVRTGMVNALGRSFKQTGGGLLPKDAASEIRQAVKDGVDIDAVLAEVRKLKADAGG